MKVFELLSEIEEIVDNAASVPLMGKIMIEPEELLEIVKEIKDSLPEEVHKAQWIETEKDKILSDAKKEYETIVCDAKRHADSLVEENEIVTKSKSDAEELMKNTENAIKQLKMSTYDYMDGILFDFQERINQLSDTYFNELVSDMERNFSKINNMLEDNRGEIKDMAYRTQLGQDLEDNFQDEER